MPTRPPYQRFQAPAAPAGDSLVRTGIIVANEFSFAHNGRIVGMSYFRDLGDGGNHLAVVRDVAAGTLLGARWFQKFPAAGSGADGWHNCYFHPQIHVVAGTVYKCMVFFSLGWYWQTRGFFTVSGSTVGDISSPQDATPDNNGSFVSTLTFNPTASTSGSLHGIDVLYRRWP